MASLLQFSKAFVSGENDMGKEATSVTIVETITQIDGEEGMNSLCLVVILSSSK